MSVHCKTYPNLVLRCDHLLGSYLNPVCHSLKPNINALSSKYAMITYKDLSLQMPAIQPIFLNMQ